MGASAIRHFESLYLKTHIQRRARSLGVYHGQPQPRHHFGRHFVVRRRRTIGAAKSVRRGFPQNGYLGFRFHVGFPVFLAMSSPGVRVIFEPEHLRRILVNLLDNAHRYSSGNRAAIVVCTQINSTANAQLIVWSDGPVLEPTVQKHLFEPFFSSESRSSGLGLYICRELCEQHGAILGYARKFAPTGRMDAAQGNSFMVLFQADVPLVPVTHVQSNA